MNQTSRGKIDNQWGLRWVAPNSSTAVLALNEGLASPTSNAPKQEVEE